MLNLEVLQQQAPKIGSPTMYVELVTGAGDGGAPAGAPSAPPPAANGQPGGYSGPPPMQQGGGYGGPPPQQGGYGGPLPQQGGYGGPPPQQGSYGGPPPQANGGGYGGPPPQQGGYGQQQGGYGGPPPGGAYGAPPPAGPYGGSGGPPPNPYGPPGGGGSMAPQYRGSGPVARNEAPPNIMPINSLNSYQVGCVCSVAWFWGRRVDGGGPPTVQARRCRASRIPAPGAAPCMGGSCPAVRTRHAPPLVTAEPLDDQGARDAEVGREPASPPPSPAPTTPLRPGTPAPWHTSRGVAPRLPLTPPPTHPPTHTHTHTHTPLTTPPHPAPPCPADPSLQQRQGRGQVLLLRPAGPRGRRDQGGGLECGGAAATEARLAVGELEAHAGGKLAPTMGLWAPVPLPQPPYRSPPPTRATPRAAVRPLVRPRAAGPGVPGQQGRPAQQA